MSRCSLALGEPEIHFDDVRERHQRRPFGGIHKIIQRDGVSRCFQALADLDDFFVGINGFENFDHHDFGGNREI